MHSGLKMLASGVALALAVPAIAQVYAQPYQAPVPYDQPRAAAPPGGVYGAPAPVAGYGPPASGYGAPAPAPGYGTPSGTYAPPTPGYGAAAGPGAAYGAPPASGYGAPPAAAYGAPAAGAYGANSSYAPPPVVKCDKTGAIAGGLVGALAGGVLGSNVAGHGDKTEGTVLGGVVGGGLGALVGHAHDKHRCDQTGAYWSYADTVPYQADTAAPADPRTAEYVSRGCRLAPAAVEGQEARYVRVCPDASGRYRISG